MSKKLATVSIALLALVGCASNQPRIIQSSPNSPEVTVTSGMATQIEMPDNGRVQSIVVGNPGLLTAESKDDVVNLTAKDGTGQTNLIVRSREGDEVKVYQYHVTVQAN